MSENQAFEAKDPNRDALSGTPGKAKENPNARDLVYLSFSYSEEVFRNELRTVLLRDVRLQEFVWDDKCLSPGDDYPSTFNRQVARTRIMVMLVSPRYLDAEHCQAWKYEIPQAIAAHQKGELTIMWVPIRAVKASETPFPYIQSALPLSTPLAEMDFGSRQRAYDELRYNIRRKLRLDKSGVFDVFLSHNSKDKPHVRELFEKLKQCGLQGWLDEEQLRPGIPWQKLLEEAVTSSASTAVLVGNDGLGPWEDEEMQAALSLAVEDKRPIIPVLLPSAPTQPKLPMFLRGRTWVDLRGGLTEAGIGKLVWGITGKMPGQSTMTKQTAKPVDWTEQVTRYMNAEDYVDALFLYQKAADAGNRESMYNLGRLYENGMGTPQDYDKAREWYQRGADAGNTDAMSSLSWLYLNGWGGAMDYGKARELSEKAAEAGDVNAMSNLGWLYINGWGVARDYGKAREWYDKAAEGSDKVAMYNLGWLCEMGKGGVQDYDKAREWYQKAADLGYWDAEQALLRLHPK